MENERSDDCQLCCEIYEYKRRPRILLCGHSYCAECLEKLLQNECRTCPICNASIKTSNVSDFSINYALERAVYDLKQIKHFETLRAIPTYRNKRLQKLIDHHYTCSRELLDSARELSEDIQSYVDFLSLNKEKHETMAEKLEEKCDIHTEIIQVLQEERNNLAESDKEVTDHIEKLEAALPQLDKVADNTGSVGAVDTATTIFGELADFLDKCKKDYPDPTIANAQKLLRPLKNLRIEEANYKEQLNSCSGFPDILTVSEKISMCKLEEYFTASQLRTAPEDWRKKIQTGNVTAKLRTGAGERYANISVTEDQVYLHCFRDRKHPQLSFLIKYDEIISCVKEPKVVFLDIAWNGVPKGRVHIKLTAGSTLAEYFLSLCVGNLGPTYLNRKFDQVVYGRWQTERIGSQPYGGAGVLNGKVTLAVAEFHREINRKEACQGIVWMEEDYTFYVLTGVGRDCVYNRVFGGVTQGLELLKESANRIIDGAGEVEIADTGVVLDF